jgi:hypothetical protein
MFLCVDTDGIICHHFFSNSFPHHFTPFSSKFSLLLVLYLSLTPSFSFLLLSLLYLCAYVCESMSMSLSVSLYTCLYVSLSLSVFFLSLTLNLTLSHSLSLYLSLTSFSPMRYIFSRICRWSKCLLIFRAAFHEGFYPSNNPACPFTLHLPSPAPSTNIRPRHTWIRDIYTFFFCQIS